jgi:hypothetical protein
VLADFFFSSSTPGSRLGPGPVAAQMYEYSYTENPPNCVGGIRELFYCLLIVSLLLALLLNTSRSFTLLRIICLVSTMKTFTYRSTFLYGHGTKRFFVNSFPTVFPQKTVQGRSVHVS